MSKLVQFLLFNIQVKRMFCVCRIEQPHLSLSPVVMDGLSQCKLLQRLCVVAKHSSFQQNSVIGLFLSVSLQLLFNFFYSGTGFSVKCQDQVNVMYLLNNFVIAGPLLLDISSPGKFSLRKVENAANMMAAIRLMPVDDFGYMVVPPVLCDCALA